MRYILSVIKTKLRWLVLVFCVACVANQAHADSYKYFRIGNKDDAQTKPVAGIAMMGGGSDVDEAFAWLCNKGTGGDFLILRATGDVDYNAYVNKLCKVNSVATLIIPNREAAEDPAVAEIIRKAEVVFIAGGDQANYIRDWKETPVQTAMNENIRVGKPIGGTSAGLAIKGEFVYSATGDKPDDKNLSSADVLRNPYFERVTLVREFLKIPHLENLLTDSHFARRDRMGRTLGFLARIMKNGWSQSPREVAIDEKSDARNATAPAITVVLCRRAGAATLNNSHNAVLHSDSIPAGPRSAAASVSWSAKTSTISAPNLLRRSLG